MISKSILVLGLAGVLFVGLTIGASSFIIDASGQTPIKDKPTVPRNSETCAHGHNGFDCKPSSLRSDINELQKRVTELERRS